MEAHRQSDWEQPCSWRASRIAFQNAVARNTKRLLSPLPQLVNRLLGVAVIIAMSVVHGHLRLVDVTEPAAAASLTILSVRFLL